MTTRLDLLLERRPFLGSLALGLAHSVTFALAFPPFDLWPLVFVTLIPLMLVAGTKRAPLAVFIACLPAFGFHHWWLKDVTLVGTPMLVVYMSVYPALFVWLLGWLKRRCGILGILLGTIVLWPALEFVRGELFAQGYPWYLLGQPLFGFNSLSRTYEIWSSGGGYALGLFLSCMNLVLMLVSMPNRRMRIRDRAIIGMIGIGLVYFHVHPKVVYEAPQYWFRIAVIQTNIPQSNKQFGTIAEHVENFERFINLTEQAASNKPPPDLIVWPETMVPVVWGLNESSYVAEREYGISLPIDTPSGPRRLSTTYFRDELEALQRAIDVPMLVGATAVEGLTFGNKPDGSISIDFQKRYNSVFLIENGEVQEERYDKITLTPFGEVMPYISAWPWLEKQLLALGAQGMTFDLDSGTKRTVFEVLNSDGRVFRIVTPICFEITYAGTCRELVFEDGARRADVMINLTNDGWFGGWDAGRELHLNTARWRASELRTPVVRAANTGFSASIDDQGRELSRLESNAEGVLHVEVAKGQGVPPFARIGFVIPWLTVLGSIILLSAAFFRGPRSHKNSQDESGLNADDAKTENPQHE